MHLRKPGDDLLARLLVAVQVDCRILLLQPAGAMTEIRAEAPMVEMLAYAPDLRSITQGQGDYTLEFLRYEEVPAHLAAKVVRQAGEERAAIHV